MLTAELVDVCGDNIRTAAWSISDNDALRYADAERIELAGLY
jgi:hypothetical protein